MNAKQNKVGAGMWKKRRDKLSRALESTAACLCCSDVKLGIDQSRPWKMSRRNDWFVSDANAAVGKMVVLCLERDSGG